jgi:hypothetical protein
LEPDLPNLAARTNLLDASALVMLVTDEPLSEKLHLYLQQEGSWFTTPFCFYEALGVLKVKYLYRKEITEDVFRKASFDLMADYRGTPKTHDLDLMDPYCFSFIQNLAKKYNLDISDAFQIGVS